MEREISGLPQITGFSRLIGKLANREWQGFTPSRKLAFLSGFH